MGYVVAELDLGPIDKVDVRNELRRFTMFPASGVDLPNFASHCKPKVCLLTIQVRRLEGVIATEGCIIIVLVTLVPLFHNFLNLYPF